MEKNCVASFFIKLSSRATAIPLSENDLIALVRAYRYLNRNTAVDVLFKLKYGTLTTKKDCLSYFTQKSINKGEFICNVDDYFEQKFADFTDEDFCLLADELQMQYMANDPVFLDIHSIRGLPHSCHKELNSLQQKMEDNPLLCFMAVKKCVKFKKNPLASKCIVQLLSNNPADQTIALANLGFDFNYRVCLKPFSNEIGALLLSIRQIYIKHQKLLNSQDSLALPIISLLQEIIHLDVEIYKYINQGSSRKNYHHSDSVTSFEGYVIQFLETLANISHESFNPGVFSEYSKKLQELGSSVLAMLLSKLEYRKIFSEEDSEGILYFAVTDISLSRKMCFIQAKYNTNKALYELTLNDFRKFLFEHFGVK